MAIYHIGPGGSPGNPGSELQPKQKFSDVASGLQPGDIVYYLTGTYGDIIEGIGNNGASNNPILVAAKPGHTVKLIGKANTPDLAVMDRSYVKLADLTLEYGYGQATTSGSNNQNRWNWVDISASNVTIDGVTVRKLVTASTWRTAQYDADYRASFNGGDREVGIQIRGNAQGIEIFNCEVSGVSMGVQLSGLSKDIWVHHCHIHDVVQSCFVVHGTDRGTTNPVGLLVEWCSLGRTWQEDIVQHDTSKDVLNSDTAINVTHCTYRYCFCYDAGENIIDLKSAGEICFEYNVCWGTVGSNNGWYTSSTDTPNRNSFACITKGANKSCRRTIVRHNVFVNNCKPVNVNGNNMKCYNNLMHFNNNDYSSTDSDYDPHTGSSLPLFVAFYMRRSSFVGTGFKNNIAGGCLRGPVLLGFHSSSTLDIDGNIYYVAGKGAEFVEDTGGTPKFVNRDYAGHKTLLASKSMVTGKDVNSKYFQNSASIKFNDLPDNPTLANVGATAYQSYDFGLQSDSPGKGASVPLTKTTNSGTGNKVKVADSTWFRDNFFNSHLIGDPVCIGGVKANVTLVNDSTNEITLDRTISWGLSADVQYGSVYNPDAGPNVAWITGGGSPTGTPAFLTGVAPFSVQFAYTGTGCTPDTFSYERSQDGGAYAEFATTQNPLSVFTLAGKYDVRLTATCPGGSPVVATKTNFVEVL